MTQEVTAVVNYGAGNLRSAAKALEAAGADRVVVTRDPADIRRATRIVLPGVGAFGACAKALRAVPGLEEALDRAVRDDGVPFLGICVGMQLMAETGLEFGTHRGLGWIGGSVAAITVPPPLKIPQIGWNLVAPKATPDRAALIEEGYAYFVHGFALRPTDPGDIAATTRYGSEIVSAVQRANMLGVQFHPEKSQRYGLALIARWLRWKP